MRPLAGVQCTFLIGATKLVVGEFTQDTEILVIGGGPTGREAARRCAELGKQTLLADPDPLPATTGVENVQGSVRFADKRSVQVTGEHVSRIRFKRAIVCTGCHMGPNVLRGLEASGSWREPAQGRVLVAGSGTLAVTVAMQNATSGADVVLACPGTQLLPSVDPIISAVIVEHLVSNQVDLLPNIQFAGITQDNDSALVVLDEGTVLGEFDKIIAAHPIGGHFENLDLQNTAVEIESGWIKIAETGTTAENRILAAGGCTGLVFEPAAAAHHGRLVAESACGLDATWDPAAIPAFLEAPLPMSWCGLNEAMATEEGHDPTSIGLGKGQTIVRMVHDRQSGLLLGAGATGSSARIVGEAATMALEMGATIEDLAALSPVAQDRPGLADVARTAWKPTS
ncbi:MAG: FAD-dependent oxidoreductase [Phycisphaerales bacterium]|nr:FAD-dependent oxidoreductase [Phycisphaerales bacterium]